MKYCLAIDLGATSGRHIVGHEEKGRIITDEVYRFPNGAVKHDGHLVWDLEGLLKHIKKGIDAALEKYEIESLSVDTWGVDLCAYEG